MLYEVCLQGRGGQGAAMAARVLVQAACLEGLWGQAFPLFGGERRGAPVYAFARISDRPVRLHSRVYTPDAVIVLDRALIEAMGVRVKEGGLLLVNSPARPHSVNAAKARIFWVDATSIATQLGLVIAGWPVVNTAMLGAFARASGLVKLSSLREAIRMTWRGELGEVNARAAERGYEEVMGA
ncbi:MAG: pyruvate synthase [Thermoprotei archaeon]|nr:MAG: pyruvate synthase [Thermoprotei archaeon]